MYPCTVPGCTSTFLSRQTMSEHNKKEHSTPNPVTCEFEGCTKVFATRVLMHKHMYRHTASLPCYQCDETFKDHGNLRGHRLRHHGGTRNYECEDCEKRFLTQQELDFHQAAHTNERPFLCNVDGCAQAFKEARKLTAHINMHNGLKLHPCSVQGCPKFFSQVGHMKIHVDTVHHKLRSFDCECGATFGRADGLRNHARLRTGEKPFRCDIDNCEAAFAQPQGLHGHVQKCHVDQYMARHKLHEQRVADHLLSCGFVERTNLGDKLPAAGEFKREHRVYFQCFEAASRVGGDPEAKPLRYCRIDFIIGAGQGGHVFLEVDEDQHRFGYGATHSCDFKRMHDVMHAGLLDPGCHVDGQPGLRVLWLRYNPTAWHVDGSVVTVPTKQRLEWLAECLRTAHPNRPGVLEIEYAFYDLTAGALELTDTEDYPDDMPSEYTDPSSFGLGVPCT